ncbi:MAG: hypothetical protein KA736_02320 [Crocinitomicaceae bacterium]|nr:hypothetical protein [Crocinitomicaceae bacterium]MBP6032515.1 hypothetical protein [Crocinitomicaceae bacterium]
MKKITVLYIISIIFLGSCSIEKRLYRPGYNVEWKSSKISASTIKNDDSSTELIVIENKTKKASSSDKVQIKCIPSKENQLEIENICRQSEVLSENHNETDQRKIDEVKSKLKTINVNGLKKLKTISNKKISKTETKSGDGNGALKGIGWFFIIIGTIMVIFVSILIGILLMLLGLLFFVVGKSS